MKLPRYCYTTDYGVIRFRRDIPEHLHEVIGKKRFNKVLGRSYREAMKTYSQALRDFDSLIAAHSSTTPDRETILGLVQNAFGVEASMNLARGQVDENLEYALMDLGDRLEAQGSLPREITAKVYSGTLPDMVLSLGDCLDRYWAHKRTGDDAKDRLPKNVIDRAKVGLVEALGDKAVNHGPVGSITRKDVNRFRDNLLAKLKPSSVQRSLGVVRTALNFCIKEDDLDIRNPFADVIIKGATATKDDRLPLSPEEVSLLNRTFEAPDDICALWTTLRDTGARMSEIVYLTVGDVSLQDKTVRIGPNALRGTLKTTSSVRTIPLSDAALSKLQALRQGKEDDAPIFDRYAKPRGADGASQVLMKRLRKHIVDKKKTVHSLRHSMKDKLRNAGVQEELAKAIMGHSDGSVASRYGSGYSSEVMRKALERVW